MEIASLIVAVCGLVLACLSLGWQAATYVLSGGRVKVGLRIGAISGSGLLLSAEPSSLQDGWFEELAEQGYRQPVVAVEVSNVGRMAVTVARWSIVSPRGVNMSPMGASIGPALPHRLEAGESATWAVAYEQVRALSEAAKVLPARNNSGSLFFPRSDDRLCAVVELGNGRKTLSRQRM